MLRNTFVARALFAFSLILFSLSASAAFKAGSAAALNKYMTLLAVALRPKGVLVELYQPVFVATKDDTASMRGAAPVNLEVAKLIKLIDTQGSAANGKITNFSTGKIDAS